MLNQKTILAIFAISFLLAVGCGLLDRETESILHLLTAEIGNLAALLIYTSIFSAIGFSGALLIDLGISSARSAGNHARRP